MHTLIKDAKIQIRKRIDFNFSLYLYSSFKKINTLWFGTRSRYWCENFKAGRAFAKNDDLILKIDSPISLNTKEVSPYCSFIVFSHCFAKSSFPIWWIVVVLWSTYPALFVLQKWKVKIMPAGGTYSSHTASLFCASFLWSFFEIHLKVSGFYESIWILFLSERE